jgi:ABC-type oligopeptide transport system substrate-binding subunit
MRIGLSALAAAALIAGAATAVVAQTQTAPGNPNTKVYAYKKTAPSTMNPGVNADPNTTARQQKPFEHLIPDAQPYGTAAWWQEMSRTTGGDGGGQ